MRLLVLGGTGFVGGAVVAEAVRRGWAVTVFNRGRHGDVPVGVQRLRGDRTAPDGLTALTGGEWELVVDTWDGARAYAAGPVRRTPPGRAPRRRSDAGSPGRAGRSRCA